MNKLKQICFFAGPNLCITFVKPRDPKHVLYEPSKPN